MSMTTLFISTHSEVGFACGLIILNPGILKASTPIDKKITRTRRSHPSEEIKKVSWVTSILIPSVYLVILLTQQTLLKSSVLTWDKQTPLSTGENTLSKGKLDEACIMIQSKPLANLRSQIWLKTISIVYLAHCIYRQQASNSFQEEDTSLSSTSGIEADPALDNIVNNPESSDESVRTDIADTGDEEESSSTKYTQLGGYRKTRPAALMAVQRIQRAFSTDQEPNTLEPYLMRADLSVIQCEISRLLELERGWKRCPHADSHIFESGKLDIVGINGGISNHLTAHVRGNWSYECPPTLDPSPKRRRRRRPSVAVDWSDDNLGWLESESRICRRSDVVSSTDKHFISLSKRISSQLLLYRITLVFGIPLKSEETGGYKCCWAAELYHKDGRSELGLYDRKGSVSVHFDGTSDNDGEALDILNFLFGNSISHPYGMLAGSQA